MCASYSASVRRYYTMSKRQPSISPQFQARPRMFRHLVCAVTTMLRNSYSFSKWLSTAFDIFSQNMLERWVHKLPSGLGNSCDCCQKRRRVSMRCELSLRCCNKNHDLEAAGAVWSLHTGNYMQRNVSSETHYLNRHQIVPSYSRPSFPVRNSKLRPTSLLP
jgi:hypothetical protein